MSQTQSIFASTGPITSYSADNPFANGTVGTIQTQPLPANPKVNPKSRPRGRPKAMPKQNKQVVFGPAQTITAGATVESPTPTPAKRRGRPKRTPQAIQVVHVPAPVSAPAPAPAAVPRRRRRKGSIILKEGQVTVKVLIDFIHKRSLEVAKANRLLRKILNTEVNTLIAVNLGAVGVQPFAIDLFHQNPARQRRGMVVEDDDETQVDVGGEISEEQTYVNALFGNQ